MNRAGATVPVHRSKRASSTIRRAARSATSTAFLTLAGGREPTESAIAEAALKGLANRRHPPQGEVQVLHVDHAAITTWAKHCEPWFGVKPRRPVPHWRPRAGAAYGHESMTIDDRRLS